MDVVAVEVVWAAACVSSLKALPSAAIAPGGAMRPTASDATTSAQDSAGASDVRGDARRLDLAPERESRGRA